MTSSSRPHRVLLFAVIASHLTSALAAHVTLAPLPGKSSSASGKVTMLLLVPEPGIAHTDYKVFGRILQQMFPLQLWVGVLDTSQEVNLTLDNLPLLLAEVTQSLSQMSRARTAGNVFLAAHGKAGYLAADYARAVPEILRGLILYGAMLPERWSLMTFPLPVLTITGELDGFTRLTRIARSLQSMMKEEGFEQTYLSRSPLVLLEGTNHDVLTSHPLPHPLHMQDIHAEAEKSSAMETAANVTSLFLVYTLQEPKSLMDMASKVFQTYFSLAINITEPLRSLREVTLDKDYRSYWVKSAQKWLSGLEGKQSTQLEVDSFVEVNPGQMSLPPALVRDHGISYVITFSEIISEARGQQGSSRHADENGPVAPQEIAARMMGPRRIREYLKNTTIGRNYTCRDLNYCSFMTAYHTASATARRRFDNYNRSIIFQPDVVTDSEAFWERTKLKVGVKDEDIHVTSIAYKTPFDEALTQFSDLFFCKLLPPDRAMEWIYVDALRRNSRQIGSH